MVERLKIAVEKARAERARTLADAQAATSTAASAPAAVLPDAPQAANIAPTSIETAWRMLEPVEFDSRHLERHRVICSARTDPAHASFDVLRTRILRVFDKHGWTRVGITSPGKACGKTFVATNLAFSFSRQPDCRVVLMDMDLRIPGVARTLGVPDPEPISWFLKGDVAATAHLRRHGKNFALGLNGERVNDAAELIQSASAAQALDGMRAQLDPTIVIYDLPPMLSCDDVMGFAPQLDCVLLIVGGGSTKGSDVTECERLLADHTHLLGVVLNNAEGASSTPYTY